MAYQNRVVIRLIHPEDQFLRDREVAYTTDKQFERGKFSVENESRDYWKVFLPYPGMSSRTTCFNIEESKDSSSLIRRKQNRGRHCLSPFFPSSSPTIRSVRYLK